MQVAQLVVDAEQRHTHTANPGTRCRVDMHTQHSTQHCKPWHEMPGGHTHTAQYTTLQALARDAGRTHTHSTVHNTASPGTRCEPCPSMFSPLPCRPPPSQRIPAAAGPTSHSLLRPTLAALPSYTGRPPLHSVLHPQRHDMFPGKRCPADHEHATVNITAAWAVDREFVYI